MISATTVPTTIARFADSLPFVNIDLSRFIRANTIADEALRSAYAHFSNEYRNLVDASFNETFLASDGASIIESFAAGRIDRHEAAIGLASLWDSRLDPVRTAERKHRIADAAMAADSLLCQYDAALKGTSEEDATSIPEDAESHASTSDANLALTVDVDEGLSRSATVAVAGALNKDSCHHFLTQAQQLYQQGVRRLTLDLSGVTEVELSGVYALHATAKVFHGESYPHHEYGFAGLRHMVEENLAAGVHDKVRLTAINERIANKLEQSGVAEIFGM